MVQYGNIPNDVSIKIVNPSPDKVVERLRSIFNRAQIKVESPESFFDGLQEVSSE
jgi:hypothetical protein